MFLAVSGLWGCGSGSADGSGDGGFFDGGGGMPAIPGTTSVTTTATPTEQELESSYGAPIATGTYVWIANPVSGRVAYIDATTLKVRIADAGNGPTHVAAVPDPDADSALVLNVLSKDATWFRVKGSALTATSLEVPSSGNTWAVSGKGHFAIAWTDSRTIENADPIDGYQDITVLDLSTDEGKSTPLNVGYRPVAMGFDAGETRAFAVTADGITVVDLSGDAPFVSKNIPLSDTLPDNAGTRDVAITPDGQFALVRRDGEAVVRVFSLGTGERTDVTLSGPVTDLDLLPGGEGAIAVVRDTGEAALMPIPEIFADPTGFVSQKIDNAIVGSVSLPPGGQNGLAFLYTNAIPSQVLVALDTASPGAQPSFFQLWAPIQAVFPTPDGAHALVLHDTAQGSTSTYPAAMSVLPVTANLPAKLKGLVAPVRSVAVSPKGHRALVATGDNGAIAALYVAAMPSLEVTEIPLASQPISAGIVDGADKGFVAQTHPDGRITFVDFKTQEVRTITGFELAAGVVDGSTP